MLHVVTRANRSEYRDALDEMHQLRFRVLFEILGWKECWGPNGRERDESDHDDTVYLLATDERLRGTLGCLRMAPSTTPNLSACHFADLYQFEGVPNDPNIYDGSRIVVDPRSKALGKPNPVAGELLVGWLEATYLLGIDGCTAIISTQHLSEAVAVGWRMVPMGLPKIFGRDEVVPIKLVATQESIDSVRAFRKTNTEVISGRGAALLKDAHAQYLERYHAARRAA